MKRSILFVAIILMFGSVLAEEGHRMTLMPSGATIEWEPAPATLMKGIQIAVLAGDPDKPGPFVLRLWFPVDSYVAPHYHATAENLTVLSGNFFHAMGGKYDKSRGEELTAGAFVYLPARMNHYVWATSESIIQVSGTGPFGVNYVNLADDPSETQ